MEFARVERIEIMEVGHYPQGDVTDADLDFMIQNFFDMQSRGSTYLPKIKLGHGKQDLLERSGFPSAGFVSALWREGSKLVAALAEVPAVVAQLINRGAYKERSVEVDFQPRPIGARLTALALLGEELPAVETLQDFLALYDSVVAPTRFSVAAKKGEEHVPDNNGESNGQTPPKPNTPPANEVETMRKELADKTAEVTRLAELTKTQETSIKELGERVNELKALVPAPDASRQTNQPEAGKVDKLAAAAERSLRVIQAGERAVLQRDYESKLAALVKAGKLPPAAVSAGLVEFSMELDHSAPVKFSANPEPLAARLFRILEALPVVFKAGEESTGNPDGDANAGKKQDDPEARKKEYAAEYQQKRHILGDTTEKEYVAAKERIFAASQKK